MKGLALGVCLSLALNMAEYDFRIKMIYFMKYHIAFHSIGPYTEHGQHLIVLKLL